MKYLFFFAGFLLVVSGTATAAHGALNGWDASVTGFPMIVGVLMLAASFGFAVDESS